MYFDSAHNTDGCALSPDGSLLSVGLYEVRNVPGQEKQVRDGGLVFFAVNLGDPVTQGYSLAPLAEMIGPETGVFDHIWHPGGEFVAAACADGTLRLFPNPATTSTYPATASLPSIQLSEGLCSSLSLSRDDHFSVTRTDGHLSVVTASLTELLTIKAHDLEAWSCATLSTPGLTLTGADDCLFKGWDARTGGRVFVNKSHEMGVCGISPSPHDENTVATTSYDERFRIWDARNWKQPVVTSPSVGGGAWRLRWHPSKRGIAALACMYMGFSVWDTDKVSELAREEERGASIAYGVEWIGQDHLATTTFSKAKSIKLSRWECVSQKQP